MTGKPLFLFQRISVLHNSFKLDDHSEVGTRAFLSFFSFFPTFRFYEGLNNNNNNNVGTTVTCRYAELQLRALHKATSIVSK